MTGLGTLKVKLLNYPGCGKPQKLCAKWETHITLREFLWFSELSSSYSLKFLKYFACFYVSIILYLSFNLSVAILKH